VFGIGFCRNSLLPARWRVARKCQMGPECCGATGHQSYITVTASPERSRSQCRSMSLPLRVLQPSDIQWHQPAGFGTRPETPTSAADLHARPIISKGTLYEFTRRYDLDLLIVIQNALCHPN